jgi:O-antigen ligase
MLNMRLTNTNNVVLLLKKGYFSYLFAIISMIILAINVKYLPPFMILWCIAWILENYSRFGQIFNNRKSYNLFFFLFVSYFIWDTISLLNTTDVKMGFSNLFSRLSLILFPLVLFYPGEKIKDNVRVLLKIFAISTCIFMLFCFGHALYRSINIHDGIWTFDPHSPKSFWLNYFYGSELTGSQHPSYVSMYVILSVFICFEIWFDYSQSLLKRISWFIPGILLIISLYFLSSRAGILICIILIPGYFIYKFNQLGRRKFSWVWIILIIIVVLPVILKNQRVDYLYGRLSNKQIGYERKQDQRFLIWESALKIAKENLVFGQGIGDAREELSREYARRGELAMAKERLNAHNQFLEVLLESGIVGLLLFLSIFSYLVYRALSQKNILLGLYIIMIAIFFTFESMLNRLAGVTFFALFSFLLLYLQPSVTSSEIVKED